MNSIAMQSIISQQSTCIRISLFSKKIQMKEKIYFIIISTTERDLNTNSYSTVNIDYYRLQCFPTCNSF